MLKYPDVIYFDMGDVKTSFTNFMNAICKNKRVDEFTIGVKSNADLSGSSSFSSDGLMSIDRLKVRDVTQIDITYNDDSKELFLVKWDCDDNYTNDKQVFDLTPDGNYIFYSYVGDAPPTECINKHTTSIDFLANMKK